MGAKFGHPVTPETRAKLRVAFVGRPKTQEFKDRVSMTLRAKLPNGQFHHAWRGGLWKHHSGYVYVYRSDHPHHDKDKYIKRSHAIMESVLGRILNPGEVVHHLNEVKDDDRPENLMLFSCDGEHQKFHIQNGTHAFVRRKK